MAFSVFALFLSLALATVTSVVNAQCPQNNIGIGILGGETPSPGFIVSETCGVIDQQPSGTLGPCGTNYDDGSAVICEHVKATVLTVQTPDGLVWGNCSSVDTFSCSGISGSEIFTCCALTNV